MDGGDGGEPENIWSIDRGAVTSKLSCCRQELKPRIVRSSNVNNIIIIQIFKNNLKSLFIMTDLLIFKKFVY